MKKTILSLAASLVSAAALASASQLLDYGVRQAIQGAMGEVETALASAPVPAGEPVAVLPIDADDDGWLAGQLKIALTKAGKTCVEGRDDPMWGEILKEITWDARKEDILDPATVDRFGKLQSAKYLLSAFVRSCYSGERCSYAEFELHLTSIATKRHVWGGSFARRHYAPGSASRETGAVDIPLELRRVMQGRFRDEIRKSIASAPKLADVKTVAFLPFAGDVDGYAADIVRDAVSGTSLTPVNLDLDTLAEARLALRDSPGQADALLRGSLRDLSIVRRETAPHEMRYVLSAEIQACIESAGTHAQLWSDTILVSEEWEEERGAWAVACTYVPVLRGRPWLAVAAPLALVLALLLLRAFLKATTRAR